MGGALILLQGAAALCWLVGRHGARGGLAALLVFLLAWVVEHAGVTTGMPFGRYYYTGALQPQIFGTVPLAIPCAWLMVAAGAWQIATTDHRLPITDRWLLPAVINRRGSVVVMATLVLLLDLQIETVATKINHYWIWRDGGPYYGVPTANFVAWWLTGMAMAVVVATVLPGVEAGEIGRQEDKELERYAARLIARISCRLPAYLYLLSTLMFAIVNLAHGYTVAGAVGVLVLLVVARAARPADARQTFSPRVEGAEGAD
jgi:putative membrane protein